MSHHQYLYADSDGVFRWHEEPQPHVPTATFPMASEAAAVHPSQIGDFREAARKSGVPTEFTRSGRPIFTSLAHQRKYLKHRGLFNKGAYL